MKKELMDFLCAETVWEDMGDENLLYRFPEFKNTFEESIRNDKMLDVSLEFAAVLEEMDLYKAGLLSNLVRYVSEKDDDVSAGQKVMGLFSRSCGYVYEMLKSQGAGDDGRLPGDMGSVFGKNKDWVRAFYSFPWVCASAMAFLTKDASFREFIRKQPLLDQVTYLLDYATSDPHLKMVIGIAYMQDVCGKEKLLVLLPGKESGFFAMANNLNNCFHLFFLLEEQIYQKFAKGYGMGDFPADASLIRLAHGEHPAGCGELSYGTYFWQCTYHALWHTELEEEDKMQIILGQESPMCIPEIDGYKVIVLFDFGFHRSIGAEYLTIPHKALRPEVEIGRELTKEEYGEWIGKIRKG